jgi:hypothetical protein
LSFVKITFDQTFLKSNLKVSLQKTTFDQIFKVVKVVFYKDDYWLFSQKSSFVKTTFDQMLSFVKTLLSLILKKFDQKLSLQKMTFDQIFQSCLL